MDSLPKRKYNRLAGYDYSRDGIYYVTICANKRKNVFGKIVGDGFPVPMLSKRGKILDKNIMVINKKYPTVSVNKYIIMPNHLHLIITIENDGTGNPSPTISTVIGWLKYNTTKEVNRESKTKEKLFQRSFYDHIIRSDEDYLEISRYIDENPLKWELDKYYRQGDYQC